MGWPKKEEGLRLYFERKYKSYMIYDPDTNEYIGEALIDNNPEDPHLASGSTDHRYIYCKCKRVSWSELP